MTVLYGKCEMPEKISSEVDPKDPRKARFIAEPLERGSAHTIGNPLRRILLSLIEAPAIVSVHIQGVEHEFMAVEGIIEDITDVILNFKGALLRRLPLEEEHFSRDIQTATVTIDVSQADLDKAKGNVAVTLGDVVQDGLFEVVNPDLHLFTITKPLKREITLQISYGRGYVPSERHQLTDISPEVIVVDSAFSPVTHVNYFVENTRVGQDTDYDRLVLEIETDGRITPEEALSFATQIALKHFQVLSLVEGPDLSFQEEIEERDEAQDELLEKLSKRIDEIELSVRSTNCLRGANIATIAELVTIPEKKMLEFRNFGKKSLNEIKDKLVEMSLSLGMDLKKFGITPENIHDKVSKYLKEKEESLGQVEE